MQKANFLYTLFSNILTLSNHGPHIQIQAKRLNNDAEIYFPVLGKYEKEKQIITLLKYL